jgi:hypothetical protein
MLTGERADQLLRPENSRRFDRLQALQGKRQSQSCI